jgi:GTP-binding protein
VKESDVVLFVVDDTVGITAKEQHILDLIRREKKLNVTMLIVNKLDVKRKESETDLALADYYDLGVPTVIGISAKTERNLFELQEQITLLLKEEKEKFSDETLLSRSECVTQQERD